MMLKYTIFEVHSLKCKPTLIVRYFLINRVYFLHRQNSFAADREFYRTNLSYYLMSCAFYHFHTKLDLVHTDFVVELKRTINPSKRYLKKTHGKLKLLKISCLKIIKQTLFLYRTLIKHFYVINFNF